MIRLDEPEIKVRSLYRIGEASKVLGVHRNTLRNYVDQRLIKVECMVLDGRTLIRGKELLKFWRSRVATRRIR